MSSLFELLEEKEEKGTSVDLLVKIIMQLIELGKYDQTKEYLDELELFEEASFIYCYLKGNLYEKEDKLDDARIFYERAVDLNPGFLDGFFSLANIYDKLDLIQDSIDTYNYLLTTDFEPKDIAYINLSAILEENGYYNEAIELLKEALDNGCLESDIYYNLGVNYMKLEKYSDAIFYYNEAMKFDEYDDYLLFNLGVCYKDNKEYLKALDYYNLSMDEKGVIVDFTLYNMACVYALMDNSKECIKYLSHAFDLNQSLIEFASNDEELQEDQAIIDYVKSASKK